jgi:photosystem II stability/assembly factor-like uncharacterized protein
MRTRPLFPLLGGCVVFALSALLAASLFGPASSRTWADGPAWTSLGGPRGGAAQALAVNPQYPNDPVVFAGGGREVSSNTWLGLGVFGSHDGGLTWPDRSGPANGAALDIAFSPSWQSDGYAAVAFFQDVWSTGDRGATWQQLPSSAGGGPTYLHTVAVSSPTNGMHTLLAAGLYGGIHRSPDNGTTWHYDATPGTVRRVRFSPGAAGLALAAGSGIWRSTDAGKTWSQVFPSGIALDVAFTGDGAAAYATIDGQVWHSPDAGQTWQLVPGPKTDVLDSLGVSADGAGVFTAAGNTLYRFDLGAGVFVTETTNLPAAILRLQPSPAFGTDHILLAGTPDGVFVSTDGGTTFTPSEGFAAFRVTDIEGSPNSLAGGDLFLAGEYGVWKRTGGAWQPANNGMASRLAHIVNDLAVSPSYEEDGTLFAAANRIHGIGGLLFKSTDRGASWRQVYSSAGVAQVVVSPAFATDHMAFINAYNRVQRSSDGGETWAELPFWSDYRHSARLLAISPNFAADHALYAVGSEIYYSHDAGGSWQVAAVSPPLNTNDSNPWWAEHLTVSPANRLYLVVGRYDAVSPYRRHSQLWTSADRGVTWQQAAGAPDLPVAGLAAGPHTGGGETIYLSVFDDDDGDDRPIAPDLLASYDLGQSWRNLGAIPQGPTAVLRPPAVPDQAYVGTVGAWLLAAAAAPPATPDPCQELLLNRSFEYDGAWRIPQTAYPAGRLQDKHSYGYWSMRSGIVDPAANVRSYSDFSQDVVLPAGKAVTLRFQRWPMAPAKAALGAWDMVASIADGTATLDEFYRLLDTSAGDLQYGMLIAPPGGKIKYLYTGLADDQRWIDQVFDLSAYGGQTVRLQFGTYNDGAGTVAAQYFDNFSLQACGTAGPTPTPAHRTWMPFIERPNGGGTIPPR